MDSSTQIRSPCGGWLAGAVRWYRAPVAVNVYVHGGFPNGARPRRTASAPLPRGLQVKDQAAQAVHCVCTCVHSGVTLRKESAALPPQVSVDGRAPRRSVTSRGVRSNTSRGITSRRVNRRVNRRVTITRRSVHKCANLFNRHVTYHRPSSLLIRRRHRRSDRRIYRACVKCCGNCLQVV